MTNLIWDKMCSYFTLFGPDLGFRLSVSFSFRVWCSIDFNSLFKLLIINNLTSTQATMFLYSCRFRGLCIDFNLFRALSYVRTNKSLPITFWNIVAVLDTGFSAYNSIIFSRLPIDFLFVLMDLIGADSCAGGEIVKSVL